jgi:UDP-N-acetylglucosamine 2-epimerase (non-hydrolysing)
MIDTLLRFREKSEQSSVLEKLGLNDGNGDGVVSRNYALLTLHRPSNVDNKQTFGELIEALLRISAEVPVVFPVHPRTMGRVREFGFDRFFNFTDSDRPPVIVQDRINACPPLGYLDFLKLMSHASLVLTDSGGIQEETTILKVPCITVRENTERPITVLHGTNRVVGTKKNDVVRESLDVLRSGIPNTTPPPLWDGKAAERILSILSKAFLYQRSEVGPRRSEVRNGLNAGSHTSERSEHLIPQTK